MTKIWTKYRETINANCRSPFEEKALPYWRDKIFATSVTYVLPLSLFALIPGVPLAYLNGFWGMLAVDLISISLLLFIAFYPSIKLDNRKRFFTVAIYLIALMLLYYMGNFGPALVYLLAASVFSALIFPASTRFYAAHINLLIVLLYALAVYMGFAKHYVIAEEIPAIGWLGVASNLVFLSYFFAYLIPSLFEGLQRSIDDKSRLQSALEEEKSKLQESMTLLESKNKELEQFAYAASHDLQEPLRNMGGFLEILEINHHQQFDEQAKSYLKHIKDSAARMSQLIQDLLKYSQLDKPQSLKKEIDMNDMLQEIIEMYQEAIDLDKLEIKFQDLPNIIGNKTAIKQLMQNLVSNAVKFKTYNSDKHLVNIVGVEKDDHWHFEIKDNGIGIEKEYQEKIFELFKRLHTKSDYPGTGIGLALCKKIVEQHGGEIWVESEVGKGSCFYFTIKK